MKCKQCGQELPEHACFCNNCGNPVIVDPVVEPPVFEEPAIEPPVVETPVFEEPIIEPPVIEEPVIEQPVIQTPVIEQPVIQTPVIEPPVVEPQVEQPVVKEKPQKKSRKKWKPGPVARVFLRLASFLLCLCLSASLLLTAVVLDIQLLSDEDNVERTVTSVLHSSSTNAPVALARDDDDEEPVNAIQDMLVSIIYDILKENSDGNMTVTKDQIHEFLARSNADEFLCKKAVGFLSDFINGTEKTTLDSDEVIELMEENEDLIEDIFNTKVDRTVKADVRNFMNENDVETLIHDQLFSDIRNANLFGITVNDLMEDLRTLTEPMTLIILILIDILLIGLLFLTNWLRIWATMRCTGLCLSTIGGLLSAPTLLIQFTPGIILKLGGAVTAAISLLVSVIAPVHYGMFIAGIALIIVAFIIKVITKLARP